MNVKLRSVIAINTTMRAIEGAKVCVCVCGGQGWIIVTEAEHRRDFADSNKMINYQTVLIINHVILLIIIMLIFICIQYCETF